MLLISRFLPREKQMKRLYGYLSIAKLLFGIYWLVLRQKTYLGFRRLLRLGGRGTTPATE